MELQRPDSPFQRGYGRKRWKTVEILEEMLKALENPLSMRDSILLAHQEKKEGESDFGNQITKALLDSIEKEDSYAFLRNREDFRKLKEKYTSS